MAVKISINKVKLKFAEYDDKIIYNILWGAVWMFYYDIFLWGLNKGFFYKLIILNKNYKNKIKDIL